MEACVEYVGKKRGGWRDGKIRPCGRRRRRLYVYMCRRYVLEYISTARHRLAASRVPRLAAFAWCARLHGRRVVAAMARCE